MSALVMYSPDGEKRTILIHDDTLFVKNFRMIFHLVKIDPARILFVIGRKTYHYDQRH